MRIPALAVLGVTIILTTATSAFAADQTIIIPGNLSAASCGAFTVGDEFDAGQARTLIVAALTAATGKPYAIESDAAYVIHLVRYNSGRMVMKDQRWFAYDQEWTNVTGLAAIAKPGARQSFTETRLFGRRKVGVVFAYEADALVAGTQVRPAPGYEDLNTLYYKVDVSKKEAANVANLRGALRLAFPAAKEAVPQRRTFCGAAMETVAHVPADLAVSALFKGDEEDAEVGKQTYDNEGRYWWDVSFALPVTTREDLSVDVEGGQIGAKKVEKTDLFAVFNIGMLRDTKKAQLQLIPTFIYGIPITGKPLQHHLLGGSFGLNYVQLFAGVRIDRKEEVTETVENGVPTGVEAATTTGDKWTHAFVWGVNIPVATVTKLLSGK